jgi:hypothetical protein
VKSGLRQRGGARKRITSALSSANWSHNSSPEESAPSPAGKVRIEGERRFRKGCAGRLLWEGRGTSGGVISFRIPRGFLGIGELLVGDKRGVYERASMRIWPRSRNDPAGTRGRKSGFPKRRGGGGDGYTAHNEAERRHMERTWGESCTPHAIVLEPGI